MRRRTAGANILLPVRCSQEACYCYQLCWCQRLEMVSGFNFVSDLLDNAQISTSSGKSRGSCWISCSRTTTAPSARTLRDVSLLFFGLSYAALVWIGNTYKAFRELETLSILGDIIEGPISAANFTWNANGSYASVMLLRSRLLSMVRNIFNLLFS